MICNLYIFFRNASSVFLLKNVEENLYRTLNFFYNILLFSLFFGAKSVTWSQKRTLKKRFRIFQHLSKCVISPKCVAKQADTSAKITLHEQVLFK